MVAVEPNCFGKIAQKMEPYAKQVGPSGSKGYLTSWDLMGLGVASTMGVGVYFIVWEIARNLAGPSILMSFTIASVFALCAGACYTELSAKMPHAGSIYAYTFATMGELPAFFVGWVAIFESALRAASVARGISVLVDLLIDGAMTEVFTNIYPLSPGHPYLYFDYFAFLVPIMMGCIMVFGVRWNAIVVNAFAIVNVIVITLITMAGLFKVDLKNWEIPKETVPMGYGDGGFFPYGFSGTLKASSLCFFGLIGFENISFAAGEARQPRRVVPRTLLASLVLTIFFYGTIGVVLTLAVPYYEIPPCAVLADVGLPQVNLTLVIGAFAGLSGSMFGALFPLPRLLSSMASDGLFFNCFTVNTTSQKTPAIAIATSTVVVGLLAGGVEMINLVEMVCAGTLFSYTAAAVCVIVLRYRQSLTIEKDIGSRNHLFGSKTKTPKKFTLTLVYVCLFSYVVCCVILALLIEKKPTPTMALIALHSVAMAIAIVINAQPKLNKNATSETSLPPIIPCIAIYGNVCLMVLNTRLWIKLIAWILLGVPVNIICVFILYRHRKIAVKVEENGVVTANSHKNGSLQIVTSNSPASDQYDLTSETTMTSMENMNSICEVKEHIYDDKKENNEDKEATVIGLIDQVLKQEEDAYQNTQNKSKTESPNINDHNIINETVTRKRSLTELSDAESDASSTYQVLPKYDVIAQVHWEDLQEVNEEEETKEELILNGDSTLGNNEVEGVITHFNETNFETTKAAKNTNMEKNEDQNLNEQIKPNYKIDETNDKNKSNDKLEVVPRIPIPPPLDERYFTSPKYRRAFTVKAITTTKMTVDKNSKIPHESMKSDDYNDYESTPLGSLPKSEFISTLNKLFQKQAHPNIQVMKRSKSTGNVVETTENSLRRETLFEDLKRDIVSGDALKRLQPVVKNDDNTNKLPNFKNSNEEYDNNNNGMSREKLKLKLESLLISNGPNMLRPTIIKSSNSTPEIFPTLDDHDTEIQKTNKEKNDTLYKQKAKYNEVLNSFRLSLNKSDQL